MIRAVIIDDEAKSLATLKNMIRDYCPDVLLVAEGQSVKEGIQVIEAHHPELVFLDIAMPDGDGFELLKKVQFRDFQVIFTTAYNEYALRAFEFAALHYLLKPIDIEMLEEAVQRFKDQQAEPDHPQRIEILQDSLKEQYTRIALPSLEGVHFVDLDQIIRLEADKNYTTFYLANQSQIIVSKPLSKYEELLSGSHFARLHHKHLVNLKYIRTYIRGKGGYVLLEDGSSVDVSVRKKEEFLRKMAKYAGSV